MAEVNQVHLPPWHREGRTARNERLARTGNYVMDPLRPAGVGWCEAITAQNEHCCTKARFERDGQRVCGLHMRAIRLVTYSKGL